MKKNITIPNKGLVTDTSKKTQPKNTYSFALNAVNETNQGDKDFRSNEESNAPCYELSPGYTPIGKVYIGNNDTLVFMVDASNVNTKIAIASEGCIFTEIFSDASQTAKLGLNVENQIDAVFRLRKGCERIIYFVDGLNVPRQINLDSLEDYKNGLGEWIPDNFTLIKGTSLYPTLGTTVGTGGNLLPGSYNIGISYLDADLNSTEVLTTSQVINIYNDKIDENYSDINGSTTEVNSFYNYSNTDKSIIVETTNIDSNYTYYRLFLIAANSSNGEVSEVTFTDEIPIGQEIFELTGDNTPFATTVEEVRIEKLHLSTAEHIEQIDNRLVLANVKGSQRDYCALQTVASAIKSDLTLTEVSLSDITIAGNPKRGEVATENLSGYMPGEIYPFGIVFAFPEGLSPAMHIPGKNSADTSDMSSNNQATNLTYTEDSCNSGFWGTDNNGDALLGEKVRHHRFPYRHEVGELLYSKDSTEVNTGQYIHKQFWDITGEFNLNWKDSSNDDGFIYIKIEYELDTVVQTPIIVSFPVIWTYEGELMELSGALADVVNSVAAPFPYSNITFETVKPDGTDYTPANNGPFKLTTFNSSWDGTTTTKTKEVNEYSSNIFGIQFSNIVLPTDCLGYYIVRMERKDADKTILDSAILTPLMKDNYYTSYGQVTPNGATLSEDYYSFISPEAKFLGKEFATFDDIVSEGTYTVATKELDTKVLQDVYAGTSYDSTIAKRREEDTDGFSLHTLSRFSKLTLGAANAIAATPDDVFYLSSLSSTTKNSESIYNASGDNRIGVIKTDARIPNINEDSEIPYVVFKKNIADSYPLFRSGAYYREHSELRTETSTDIYNGDTHISSMTYTNSMFYDIRLRNRSAKSGIWRIIGGSILVGLGAVATVFTAGAGTAVIAAGLSVISSGISQNKVRKVYEDEYEKGLSETIKDADSIATFGGNPQDDEIQYMHDTLGDVFFESTVNIGLRVEPNFGPQFFQPSPSPYDENTVLNYCIDKVSQVDTENENGRLYRGYPLAEVYKINKDYLRSNKEKYFFPLSINAQCCTDCPETFKNRVHWSEQSFQEELTDNYNSFAPLDYRDSGEETGAITDLFKIQNNLYIHTEEGLWHLPQNIQERITGDIISFIGTGSYFSIPPRKIVEDETGKSSGTKHKWGTIKTPHGVFFVCEKQGTYFQFNGNSLEPISAKGNFNWFKNNIPFKIADYTGIFDNNPSNEDGIGFISVYDSRKERILFTKKAKEQKITHYSEYPDEEDYIVDQVGTEYWMFREYQATIDLKESEGFTYIGLVYGGEPPVQMWFTREVEGSTEFFKYLPVAVTPVYTTQDMSWTMSYSLKDQLWVSWHSYLPDLYFSTRDEFYSWKRDQTLKHIWKHNTVGKFQRFYGIKYPFIVEYVSNSNPVTKRIWEDVSFITEAAQYLESDEEYFEKRNITFNKAIFYNTRQTTGELSLKVKNTQDNPEDYLEQQIQNIALDEVIIDRTEKDWFVNTLRDIRTNYDKPIFDSDLVSVQDAYFIDKVLNTDTLDLNKPWHELESFRDSHLVIRLIFDTFEDIKLILNYSIENETLSEK